ncbi:hypothetical protein JW835_00520 [bacterium]|nr:hypothetical protein [bacterium]
MKSQLCIFWIILLTISYACSKKTSTGLEEDPLSLVAAKKNGPEGETNGSDGFDNEILEEAFQENSDIIYNYGTINIKFWGTFKHSKEDEPTEGPRSLVWHGQGAMTSKNVFEVDETHTIGIGQQTHIQMNVTFTLLSDTLDQGVHYYRIESSAIEPSDKIYEGVYWIDVETYSIARMMIHPSKNPKFVKEFLLDFCFREMPGNNWMVTKVCARAYAGFLFKKARMQSEEVYSDYQFD